MLVGQMPSASRARRQLERRFLRAVGIEPKLLCRILRFRALCGIAARPGASSRPEIALECGYYDQAHMIRDVRELSGTTPVRLFPRRMSDSYNTAGRSIT